MANSIEPFHSGRQDMAQLPPIEFTKLSIHCHFGNVGDKKDADRLIDFEIDKPIAPASAPGRGGRLLALEQL